MHYTLDQLIDELLKLRQANPNRGNQPVKVWVNDGEHYDIVTVEHVEYDDTIPHFIQINASSH